MIHPILKSTFVILAIVSCLPQANCQETDKTLLNDGEAKPRSTPPQDVPLADSNQKPQAERFVMFEKMLTKVRLIGLFTVDGKPMKDLNEETYEIQSAKKSPEGDTWLIVARIKYGKNDVVVPMPINVMWAENTPVMTLDQLTIPGLGTFSARVLFHESKYAGTWVHDNVGGHLFGRLEKMETP